MSVDQAIQSQQDQHNALRDALKALLFLRAKLSAEIGVVPAELLLQLSTVKHALLACSEKLHALQTKQLVDRASERVDLALAQVEVDLAVG